MKINPFYSSISNQLLTNPEFSFSPAITPIHAHDRFGNSYYRLELPIGKSQLAIENWSLIQVHLSIYETMDPHKATLGPCHFTSEWRDLNNAKTYRLHLFLTGSDLLETTLRWEERRDEQFIPAENPAQLNDFIQSIWLLGFDCLRQLRTLQLILAQRLQAEFKAQETLWFTITLSTPEEYISQLHLQKILLSQLEQVTGLAKWMRKLRYCKKAEQYWLHHSSSPLLSSSSSQAQPLDENEDSSSLEKIEEKSLTLESSLTVQDSSPLQTEKTKQEKTKGVKHKNDLGLTILNQASRLSIEQELTEHILLLNSLHELLTDFHLQDLPSYGLTLKIEKIEQDLELKATNLLQNLLIRGDFTSATKLQVFYEDIDLEKLLTAALSTRKANLLDFLITNFKLPIATYPVTIKGITYPNALIYCYQTHTEKNSMLDCFSLLIKNGANLMQAVDAEKPPLAYMLLHAKPQHPLYQALEDNSSLTLTNKDFYRQLALSLEHYKRRNPLSFEEDQKIAEHIHSYKQRHHDLVIYSKSLHPETLAAEHSLGKTCAKHLGQELTAQLKEDKEICQKTKENHHDAKELLKSYAKLSKATGQRIGINKTSQESLNALNTALTSITLDDTKELNFAEQKQDILELQDKISHYLKAQKGLIDASIELKKTPFFAGKKNKKAHALQKTIQVQQAKIKELEPELPLSMLNKLQALENLPNTSFSITFSADDAQELNSEGVEKVKQILLSAAEEKNPQKRNRALMGFFKQLAPALLAPANVSTSTSSPNSLAIEMKQAEEYIKPSNDAIPNHDAHSSLEIEVNLNHKERLGERSAKEEPEEEQRLSFS